jgi:integrase
MKATISTAAHVDTDLKPGLYRVSKATGLYLQVSGTKSKSWVWRYRLGGKRRDMGLGPADSVSLADARKAATAAAARRDQGVDPIAAREAEKAERIETTNQAARPRKSDRSNTFKARAERYIDVRAQSWKRANEHTLWRNPFRKFVYPLIGNMEIGDIRLSHVVEALSGAWNEVPETARRMRARIERIFDAAIADGVYERANPATARLIATQLPNKRRVIEHFRAAKLDEAPALYRRIAAAPGTACRAIEYMVLTTARPSEALHAQWSEVDLNKKLWIIPATRTKTHREHIVPLSDQAVAVLEAQAKVRVGGYVFPGQMPDAALSYNAFATALTKIGIVNATPHSFRSTFRDWAGDIGDVPRDVAEAQLAHSLGATEGAYRRGSAVEKRRVVLANYARWLAGEADDNVIAFPKVG